MNKCAPCKTGYVNHCTYPNCSSGNNTSQDDVVGLNDVDEEKWDDFDPGW